MATVRRFVHLILCFGFLAVTPVNARCGRLPSEYTAPRSSSLGKFRLRISGNPDSYLPDTNYTVIIEGETHDYSTQRFTGFNLVVEPENIGSDSGKFELVDLAQTKFSENCRNMIKQTTKSYKERVLVQWTAPPSGSGCVTFRSTVIVRKDTWFQDDEPLTKVLCEDNQKVFDEQPPVLDECHACSEATYEVTFEGLWSRHTHPHNFPQDLFQTKFSKIIGAAHNKEYSLWEYEQLATDGFREVAENGDITALEAELKQQGSNIRTIIRAPGIGHPDAVKKTFATFRTTPEHHLMSLVSMIVPSPDWIVGVSKLELCLHNHSWVDKKILNLYPWDAGTDSGTTYETPDNPTIPREVIHQITVNDPNSPFYDSSGEPMKPLARLQVVRLNLFEKNCDDYSFSTDEGFVEENFDTREICSVNNWSSWTPCEVNCEEGGDSGYRSRQRQYVNSPWMAAECNRTLVDIQKCEAEDNDCWDPRCHVTSWSDWSSCYKDSTCQRRVRYRQIRGPEECNNAQNKPHQTDFMICEGSEGNCEEDTPKNCRWDLSECNVTCGQGYKELKLIAEEADDEEENEAQSPDYTATCDTYPTKNVPCDTGIPCQEGQNPTRSSFYPIDSISASQTIPNQQQFYGKQGISPNPVINCVISRWSTWSQCSATCGKSYTHRHRNILTHAQNGGTPCPKKLFKRRVCEVPSCDGDDDSDENNNVYIRKGCRYSPWTPWSACTVTCGEGKQQKTRSVIERTPGAQCDKRIKVRQCILPVCRHY